MNHYHNTNKESGDTLRQSVLNAKTQEQKILAYFRLKQYPMSPDVVQQMVLPKCPITSIRRAMTNLTRDGHLRKSDQRTMGSFGKMVHQWELVNNQLNLPL